MFSFFKKKPLLSTLIPKGFVDIHSHVLYGIDDGAKTLQDTKELLQAMHNMGFEKVITTPHTTPYIWDNTKEVIVARYEEVKDQLGGESSVQLEVASEYLMDATFLEQLQQERLLTIKDQKVLVEMSYINPPIQLFDILFELRTQGYEIILAHPERYNFYHNDSKAYAKLKKAGCQFQLNLLSVTGYYGAHVLQAANHLLEENLFDYVGSDIHHQRHIEAFGTKVQIKDVEKLNHLIAENQRFIS